jgi:starch phosphorylase
MADIEGGMFGDKEYFKPLVDSISNMKVGNDWFLVANDFASYLEAQEEVDKVSMQR